MSYLIMIFLGFLMIGIGTIGYMNNHVIIKYIKSETTFLVDSNGNTIEQLNGRLLFDKYELKEKETKEK